MAQGRLIATYEAIDTETGRKVTFDWVHENEPTDTDMAEVFAAAQKFSGSQPTLDEPPEKKDGFFSNVYGDLKRRLSNIYTEGTTPIKENVLTETPQKLLRMAGEVGGFGYDILNEGVKSAYNTLTSDLTKETLAETGEFWKDAPIIREQIETAKGLGAAYRRTKEAVPESMKNIEAGINLTGIPILKGAGKLAIMAGKTTGRGALATKEAFFPKPTPDKAIRQVLQSKGKVPGIIEKDVEKGWQAFSAVDTTGNKIYTDTIGKIDEAIPDLAKKVDVELLKDPNIYSLDELATVAKTQGGAEVSSNYVKTSLENLKELYTKIDDPVKAGNINELLAKAEREGLTKKEVNDIARIYGSEFKAFNPTTGTPPTNVNGQMYENVRQGLKEVARRGLNDTAKGLDSTMSSLLNTKRLLEQNAAASMKLQQRYVERGLGDKIGGVVLDAINLATMGGLKGFLRKAFPSNISLKMRNSAEIEGELARNLKIINDEIKRIEKPRIIPSEPLRMPGENPVPPPYDYNSDLEIPAYLRKGEPLLPPGQGFTVPYAGSRDIVPTKPDYLYYNATRGKAEREMAERITAQQKYEGATRRMVGGRSYAEEPDIIDITPEPSPVIPKNPPDPSSMAAANIATQIKDMVQVFPEQANRLIQLAQKDTALWDALDMTFYKEMLKRYRGEEVSTRGMIKRNNRR